MRAGGSRLRLSCSRRAIARAVLIALPAVAFPAAFPGWIATAHAQQPASQLPSPEASQVVALPQIEVSGQNQGQNQGYVQGQGSLSAPGNQALAAAIARQPAAVTFVDGGVFANRSAATMRDMLKDTPGVQVEERYGQEQRLSIRGAGLARGYHLRGIEVLQDGIPLNNADGSGSLYQIDPLAARGVEVWRGGSALAFGSTTLGGAINVISDTARTVRTPYEARIEAGSDGFLREHARASHIAGPVDMLVSGTWTNADGYRDHAASIYRQFNANLGWKINDRVETRFYLGFYDVRQKLPGSLPMFEALHMPRRASLAAINGNQSREERAFRIANTTSVQLDAGRLDVTTWAIRKTLDHPIFQVLAQDGWTWGVAPRYTQRVTVAGFDNDLVIGARLSGGSTDAKQYVNRGGNRGALTVRGVQQALNVEAYVENSLWLTQKLALVAGAKAFNSLRDYSQDYNSGLRPAWADRDDSARYAGVNPKIGLLWRLTPDVQVFANLTRSVDAPDFTDLTQTFAGTTVFTPLRAQKAWTFEAGTRGAWGAMKWEATYYRSAIRDEMLAYTVNPSIPANVFNAPRTRHQGVELAASIDLFRAFGAVADGSSLTLRQAWTWNDFRFDGDPVYGDNRLAGAAEHVLRTSLSWRRFDGLFVTPSIDWVPQGVWADYANTLRTPGYVLVNLEAGFDAGEGLSFFVDARNLANRRHITDVSTIANAATAPASGLAVFYPGSGRTVRVGARYAF